MPVRPRVDRIRTIYRAARELHFGWKLKGFPSAPMHNGVCTYIPQLLRVTLRFCRQSESSVGIRSFIRNQLTHFARENLSTAIYVQPVRNTLPTIRSEYGNGRMVHMNIKNLSEDLVAKHLNLMRTRSGQTIVQMESYQTAMKDSIQGTWNPFLNVETVQNVAELPDEVFSEHKTAKLTATQFIASLETESSH